VSPSKPASAPLASARLSANPALQKLSLRGAMTPSRVRRALDRVRPAFIACYEHSARQAGRNQFGSVRMDVVIDVVGRVRDPHVSGGGLPGLDDCLTAVAAKLVTEPPDTGIVSASLLLSFTP
jgi:hypothetical protein